MSMMYLMKFAQGKKDSTYTKLKEEKNSFNKND